MNPYSLPGDPYLPPGCTHADIDRAFGGADEANECSYCGGACRPGATICKRCAAEERAERRHDEMKDERQ